MPVIRMPRMFDGGRGEVGGREGSMTMLTVNAHMDTDTLYAEARGCCVSISSHPGSAIPPVVFFLYSEMAAEAYADAINVARIALLDDRS